MMDDDLLLAPTVLAALGSGLIAGNFFAFSAFLLKAFGRMPPPEGMSAMQTITAAVKGPLFLLVFFGTAALAALLGIAAALIWSEPRAVYLLAGSLLYLNGPLGVTLLRNVPLNNQLANANPRTPAGATLWKEFLPNWTFWNHVRTVLALAAATCFTWALIEGGAPLPAGG